MKPTRSRHCKRTHAVHESLRHRAWEDGRSSSREPGDLSFGVLSLHPPAGGHRRDGRREETLMARSRTYAAGVCVALLVLLSPVAAALAQPTSAPYISGVVRDVSPAPLAQAVVDVVVDGRAIATVATMEDGKYRLPVPAGVPFALRVRRAGFADFTAQMTGTSRELTRDVTMQVGAVSDTLVVTASGDAQARASVTESVSVLTRADVEMTGAAALADVLRFVPGLSVEGSGREGALTSVFARGGESDYNLVMIDGVRVNGSGGQFEARFGPVGVAGHGTRRAGILSRLAEYPMRTNRRCSRRVVAPGRW